MLQRLIAFYHLRNNCQVIHSNRGFAVCICTRERLSSVGSSGARQPTSFFCSRIKSIAFTGLYSVTTGTRTLSDMPAGAAQSLRHFIFRSQVLALYREYIRASRRLGADSSRGEFTARLKHEKHCSAGQDYCLANTPETHVNKNLTHI